MLWLCLHLPDFPFDVFLGGRHSADPWVIAEGRARESYVLLSNATAAHHGVRPGMRVSAAQALVRGLNVRERDESAEQAALERLAAWAGQFTSCVSVVPLQTLLLEVQGSLALFGGLDRLLERLRRGLADLGYRTCLAVAPTPLAATWLARAARAARITTNAELPGALSLLPLRELDLTAQQLLTLRGMGIRTMGECLRLPRDGLARRLGPDLVQSLDQALGKIPDPRTPYVAPATFEARLAFPGIIDNTEGLLFPLKRLIQELCGVLTARVAGVVGLSLALRHPRLAATRVELELVAPTREARRLIELFAERLARTELPEPVEEIVLSAGQLVSLTAPNPDFFMPQRETAQASTELIERLRARLGREAVQGIVLVADHRPERAWRFGEPREEGAIIPSGARPLWLLPQPVPLEERTGHPYLGGILDLEVERERIEAGWWDGQDTTRDYMVARNEQGERFWIFRELATRRWFLHGIFG
ncbi:MAG: Y-family DNA polymerase [Sulfuricaulis sp.]